jgi:hypothetical protein
VPASLLAANFISPNKNLKIGCFWQILGDFAGRKSLLKNLVA